MQRIVATVLASTLLLLLAGAPAASEADYRLEIDTDTIVAIGRSDLEELKRRLRDELHKGISKELADIRKSYGEGAYIAVQETLQTLRNFRSDQRNDRLQTDIAVLVLLLGLKHDLVANEGVDPRREAYYREVFGASPSAESIDRHGAADNRWMAFDALFAELLYFLETAPTALERATSLAERVQDLPAFALEADSAGAAVPRAGYLKLAGSIEAIKRWRASVDGFAKNWGTSDADMEWAGKAQGTTIERSYGRLVKDGFPNLGDDAVAVRVAAVRAALKKRTPIGKLLGALEDLEFLSRSLVEWKDAKGDLLQAGSTAAEDASLAATVLARLESVRRLPHSDSETALRSKLEVLIQKAREWQAAAQGARSRLRGEFSNMLDAAITQFENPELSQRARRIRAIIAQLVRLHDHQLDATGVISAWPGTVGLKGYDPSRSFEENLLDYVSREKPFRRYLTQFAEEKCAREEWFSRNDGYVWREPINGGSLCQNALLALGTLLDEYPTYVVYEDGQRTFDKVGYTKLAIETTRAAFDWFPNWHLYGAIGITRGSAVSRDESNPNHPAQITYFHEKLGFQYRPTKVMTTCPYCIDSIGYPSIFFNVYVGGLIFIPQSHEDFAGPEDLSDRRIIGIEAGHFLTSNIEFTYGLQRLFHKDDSSDHIEFLYVNVSVPLEAYLAQLSNSD